MEKEMKLMDLAKIVYEAKVGEYIDFVNGDKDDARHAEMVRRLRDEVRRAEIAVDNAVFYDGREVE